MWLGKCSENYDSINIYVDMCNEQADLQLVNLLSAGIPFVIYLYSLAEKSLASLHQDQYRLDLLC